MFRSSSHYILIGATGLGSKLHENDIQKLLLDFGSSLILWSDKTKFVSSLKIRVMISDALRVVRNMFVVVIEVIVI